MKIKALVCILLLTVSCEKQLPKNDIEAILYLSKCCLMNYPQQNSDGINIYFAGRIQNHSSDTISIINKKLSSVYDYNDISESLFFSVIKGDTLYFKSVGLSSKIAPNGSTLIQLHYYFNPKEHHWLGIFRDLEVTKQVLDTMQIQYKVPQALLSVPQEILPEMQFEKSKFYRVNKAPYNSFFEDIFTDEDFNIKPLESN